MKNNYDFSRAERGKFYHPDAVFSLPIYLEPDVDEFFGKLAEKRQVDIQDLVNDWIRAHFESIEGAH